MKKLLVLLFIIAGYFGVKAVINSLQEPAEGTVVVVADEPVEVTPTETATVVIMEEPTPEPEPEVITPAPVFEPLAFDGKLNKFAKANGGKKVNSPKAFVKSYGAKKKGVKVGGDFYFESEDGTLYVFHAGAVIKIGDEIVDFGPAYNRGGDAGYKAGNCYGKGSGCYPAYPPYPPYPRYGEDNYQGGYNRGFLKGLADQN